MFFLSYVPVNTNRIWFWSHHILRSKRIYFCCFKFHFVVTAIKNELLILNDKKHSRFRLFLYNNTDHDIQLKKWCRSIFFQIYIIYFVLSAVVKRFINTVPQFSRDYEYQISTGISHLYRGLVFEDVFFEHIFSLRSILNRLELFTRQRVAYLRRFLNNHSAESYFDRVRCIIDKQLIS